MKGRLIAVIGWEKMGSGVMGMLSMSSMIFVVMEMFCILIVLISVAWVWYPTVAF